MTSSFWRIGKGPAAGEGIEMVHPSLSLQGCGGLCPPICVGRSLWVL